MLRGGRGGVGHEVDVPLEVDLRRRGREVVQHVVDDPRVGGVVAVAEPARELRDRLLLAGGERRLVAHDPDAVVQVQDVDGRRLAVRVDEVRLEARDVAGDARLLRVRLEDDRVLAGPDRDRPVAVALVLDAVVGDRRDDVRHGPLRRQAWPRGVAGPSARSWPQPPRAARGPRRPSPAGAGAAAMQGTCRSSVIAGRVGSGPWV